jgi:hypothetical protein
MSKQLPEHSVNQTSATAGGDVVAGNKVTNNYISNNGPASVVDLLLEKLQTEIDENAEVRHKIESLLYYYEKKSIDGIDGLEAKLKASGREGETFQALEKKELFAKALERWSLYASAQEIFVYLLAKVEHEFSMHIYPQIDALPTYQINEIVTKKIVEPVVAECGATVFKMNHALAMGMVYWLAEQCFLRWHK